MRSALAWLQGTRSVCEGPGRDLWAAIHGVGQGLLCTWGPPDPFCPGSPLGQGGCGVKALCREGTDLYELCGERHRQDDLRPGLCCAQPCF